MGALVLFDGNCTLCSASVQFILRRDPAGYFRFASLQSAAGRALLARHAVPPQVDSVILLEHGVAYWESEAALRIARRLSGPWRLVWLARLIPRVLRDALYRAVARRRFRWFGRRAVCWLPSPQWQGRFLEDADGDGAQPRSS